MSPFRENAPVPVPKGEPPARRTWIDRVGEKLLPPGHPLADRLRGGIVNVHDRTRHWLRGHMSYALIVLLPTLLTALYYLLIAAPQYLSEAHFIVLGANAQSKGGGESGMAAMMATQVGDTNTLAVIDFVQSNDAIAALDKQVDLKAIYNRPVIDFIARMGDEPTLERMRRYLFEGGRMVQVKYDFMNFVGVIKVFAFDPEEARQVADTLLKLGDQLVDRLNKRAIEDALRVARAEVKRSEERVAAVGEKITAFRTRQKELDYSKSADTILEVIAKLENSLAQARADLAAASAYMRPDSARYAELENQVKALEGQIAAQKERLTGDNGAIAPEMAAYERLQLERTFANQDYQLAAQALEQAYLQAQRQQLFLVRTVDATAAQESEYPRGMVIVLTLFVTLTVAYGIGWLILAGVREHAG